MNSSPLRPSAPCVSPRRSGRSGAGLRRAALACACLLAVSGCSILPKPVEDPTRYYVLSGPGDGATDPGQPRGRMIVGIRNVDLPSYLRNSKSMVVRYGENELRYEDFARWAEALETGVNRVVRDRLAATPEVRAVVGAPFLGGEERDYELRIRLLRCEGIRDVATGEAAAVLSAVYEILDPAKDGEVVSRKAFSVRPGPWDGQDFGQLSALLSSAVAALADDIAANLPQDKK